MRGRAERRRAVIYRILGELEIFAGGQRLQLPAGHQLTVLAVLLINANKRVSTLELLRAAWNSTDVSTTQLHKSVSSLRRILEPLGGTHLITHAGYGYELRVAEDDLDKLVFERLIREADQASTERRVQDEVDLLREALRLWTGPTPLAGIPGDAFQREAAHLMQRRKRAGVRLFDLELGRGRAMQIIDELYTMVESHPTDRRLCEQLMLALYRSGHATDALEAFDRHAAALEAGAGARPEPGLRNLMYAIASLDERVIAQYESAGSAAQLVLAPRQLPPAVADFVGRDEPLNEGRWLLTRSPRTATPVVVVTGPAGMGKTALALQVAHSVLSEYPDGQVFLELTDPTAQYLAPDELVAQVLRAFGFTRIPDLHAERVALYRSVVGERRVLIVLDDARDEAQVRDLIPGNPGCGVLVTSRRRLPELAGAHHVPTLGPLDQPEAVEMFRRVLRRSGVDPDAEPEATQRVVELCAGMPLAVSIVAALRARDPGRTTPDIIDRLEHQDLAGFVYGDRSVIRSIGVGFDRLDDDAQQLFLGLGLLYCADFGLWTAAAILHNSGTTADPAEVLLRLAASHMIQPANPGMRYRFHDLTRRYARHRAEGVYDDPHERVEFIERVYGALLTLTRRAHRGIYDSDFDLVYGCLPDWPAPPGVLAELDNDPRAWFEAERLNIRAAVRHAAELGLDELCWNLAISAHEFYTLGRHLDDWQVTHLAALRACRAAGNVRGEAATLVMLAQPALVAGRPSTVPSLEDLSRAAELFDRLKDQHGRAIALRTLGSALRRVGQLGRALTTYLEAARLYEESDDRVGRWQSLRYMGQCHLELGDTGEALQVLARTREVAEATGQPRILAQTAYWIGQAHLATGDLPAAEENFTYVLATIGETDPMGKVYATHGLGEVALRSGALDEADHFLTAATTVVATSTVEDSVLEGRVHMSLAALRRAQNRQDEAAEALTYAVTSFDRGNAAYLKAQAQEALGDTYADRSATAEARRAWSEALDGYAEMGRPEADAVRQKLDLLPP